MSEAFGEQLLQRLPCPVVQSLCRSLGHSHFLSYFAQRVALNGYEVEDCPLAFAQFAQGCNQRIADVNLLDDVGLSDVVVVFQWHYKAFSEHLLAVKHNCCPQKQIIHKASYSVGN